MSKPPRASNARDIAIQADPRGAVGSEPDEIFGLVSVLYHALQGTTACDKYIGDAQKAGDHELESFFRACRSDEHARARQAGALLAERLAVDDEEANRVSSAEVDGIPDGS